MKHQITFTRRRGRRWFDEPHHPFPCPRAPGCLQCLYVEKRTLAAQKDPHVHGFHWADTVQERVIDVEEVVLSISGLLGP